MAVLSEALGARMRDTTSQLNRDRAVAELKKFGEAEVEEDNDELNQEQVLEYLGHVLATTMADYDCKNKKGSVRGTTLSLNWAERMN